MGWSSADLKYRREFEWEGEHPVVRTHAGDEHDGAWYASAIEARFKTRIAAINWAIARVNESGVSLYLHGLTSAKGLVLPTKVGGYLDLRGLTSADRDAALSGWKKGKVNA